MIGTALVVGGGIGGMATAIQLARRGVAVELIDIDPDWRVYGAGITMTGPTLRAYKALGMIDDIATHGAITTKSGIYRADGTHLLDLDEKALEDGLPANGGIMRPTLHRLMQERVKALGISVRLGLTVSGLENTAGGVDVAFSDGTRGQFDLVVGADSINSAVRNLAFAHMSKPERTGQGCWRISIDKPPELEHGNIFFGHRYPAGITPCGEGKVYLWLLTPHEPGDRHLEDDELFDRMKANLEGFGGNAGWIREHMSQDDWINYRPLEARNQPRPWSIGRIVLLGDAVHATTPHLASGAGMAVESAIVLAEELERHASVDAALAAYEERRFDRCRDVVETSVEMGAMQLRGATPDELGGLMSGALARLARPY